MCRNRITPKAFKWNAKGDDGAWVANWSDNSDPFFNPLLERDPDFMTEAVEHMVDVGVHPADIELWFYLADHDVDGPQRWSNLAEDLLDSTADRVHKQMYGE